jgi:spore coat protein CotF
VLKQNKKHYIPSESEFRQLYIDSYPEISSKLKTCGIKDKDIHDIMVEAMTLLIRETHISIQEQRINLNEAFQKHCLDLAYSHSAESISGEKIKDEVVLTEFMASIKPFEAQILMHAYFHHYSDREIMSRMKMESPDDIQHSKLEGLNKLMALLNASPQLRNSLKKAF